MSEAVFVQGLTKTYGGKTVVDHLNLSVSSGTVFGLLGANGAGKSTTIECMLGTKEADAGTGKTRKSIGAFSLNGSAYSFSRATIRKKSRFRNYARKLQAFTERLPTGESCADSLVSANCGNKQSG